MNTPIVYHHGIWVKKTSNGWSRLRYTNPLKPFVKAIKPGLTVNASTVFAMGCLIESFHSLGNEPISLMLESIKVIIKKTINDGII